MMDMETRQTTMLVPNHVDVAESADPQEPSAVPAAGGRVAGTVHSLVVCLFFFQAEDGIRDYKVTGVQTCALPIQAEDGIRGLQGDWSSDVCSSDLCRLLL